MAKYVRVPGPEPSKRAIDAAFLFGALFFLGSVGTGVLIALFPAARGMLWFGLACCVAAFLGLSAYYALERLKLETHSRIAVAALAVMLAGFCATQWIGSLVEDD